MQRSCRDLRYLIREVLGELNELIGSNRGHIAKLALLGGAAAKYSYLFRCFVKTLDKSMGSAE